MTGLAARSLVPRVRTLLADTETPLSVWLKLTARQGPDYSYLFESAQGGERWGRYSIIGLPAARYLQVRGREISLHSRAGETLQQWHSDDPLDFIERWRRAVRAAPAPGLPRAAGGLVGYFAYDIARYSEPRLAAGAPPDDLGLAEILLMETTEVAVFDNLMGTLSLVVWDGGDGDAAARLDELQRLLQDPLPPLPPLDLEGAHPSPDFDTSIERDDYCAMVERIRGHIAAGDLMQAVPSQRLSLDWRGDALALYRALRHTNPSPYMYLMHLGARQLVGSSPEILARLESAIVTARPIAGTRPRGADAAEDARLAGGAAGRPQGARRAPDADRPGAQRHRAGGAHRHSAADRDHGGGAILACDAHLLAGAGPPARGPGSHGCAARPASGRHPQRRAQNSRHAADRRAGAGAPRHLRRRAGLGVLARRHGYGHRHPHRPAAGRAAAHSGRRRRGGGLRPGRRMAGEHQQGRGPVARRRPERGLPMILVLDNYDSFTYNLVQYLGEMGAEVQVHRNDAIGVDEIRALAPRGILISPGPGGPQSAGVSLDAVRQLGAQIPILGVCLGHQCIAAAFGARIVRAGRIMHGKQSAIHHSGAGVLRGLPSPFRATRYHSLAVAAAGLPQCLQITAHSEEPGGGTEIMALRHATLPLEAVQFHPESVLSEHGHRLIANFVNGTAM